MEYAAGVYSLPVKTFEDYLCGLSVESSTDIPEINEPSFTDLNSADYAELEARVAAHCDYGIGKEDAKANDRGTPDWMQHTMHVNAEKLEQRAKDALERESIIKRACPYPNNGHLSQGGVQGHSAGDIFPYTIALVGGIAPTEHDYHVVGGGFKIGDCKWGSYNAAHNYATQLLNPLLME